MQVSIEHLEEERGPRKDILVGLQSALRSILPCLAVNACLI